MKKLLTIAAVSSLLSLNAFALITDGGMFKHSSSFEKTVFTTTSLPTVIVDANADLNSNQTLALIIAGDDEIIAAKATELEVSIETVVAARDMLVNSDGLELTMENLENLTTVFEAE